MFNRQAYESFKLNPEVRPTISLTLLDIETDSRSNGNDRICHLDLNHTVRSDGAYFGLEV
jgi:hypothetical protein